MSVPVVEGTIELNCSDAQGLIDSVDALAAIKTAVAKFTLVTEASVKVFLTAAPEKENSTTAPPSAMGSLVARSEYSAGDQRQLERNRDTHEVKQLIRSDGFTKKGVPSIGLFSTEGVVDLSYTVVPEGNMTAKPMVEKIAAFTVDDMNVYINQELTLKGLESGFLVKVISTSVKVQVETGDELRMKPTGESKSSASLLNPGRLFFMLALCSIFH